MMNLKYNYIFLDKLKYNYMSSPKSHIYTIVMSLFVGYVFKVEI